MNRKSKIFDTGIKKKEGPKENRQIETETDIVRSTDALIQSDTETDIVRITDTLI